MPQNPLTPLAQRAQLGLCGLLAPPPLCAAELQVPPIRYHERTLDNGLQVISVEDHASPTVMVQVWGKQGSECTSFAKHTGPHRPRLRP
ncbi:hypothetical protein [Pseudoxanthomonas winnipegensis]|uniref:hypothetical protein n=1 Tax=Pseudoxanthomonas winnipegensis TaxID=2480810 RepID=UPI003F86C6D4